MQFLFEPLAHPAQRGAAQRIEHAADHDGERDDDGQHQQRVAAAARQHAIVDLQQIDRRREQQEIVAAAIGKNEAERPHAGPQRRLQRRLRRRHRLQLERWHQHCGFAKDLKLANFRAIVRWLRDELRTGGICAAGPPLMRIGQLNNESSIWKYLESLKASFRLTDSMLALKWMSPPSALLWLPPSPPTPAITVWLWSAASQFSW